MEQVQIEGDRTVRRMVDFYNLDAIIAVGYRVNSKKATRFRQWSTKTLKARRYRDKFCSKECSENWRTIE